ncbi:hypothetical protein [Actinomadura opuntiae]|uniref:hypothetical protein n=1 Tax=Actinomadura sp. OS1-43 TaxID=604315 RepID=UPI00255AE3B3|nr:hypothetical protein [Actinomadura sp. OS1-43]MDL4814650.1 hypothetical protein [Actinomadura sp. OS1-43]
MPSGTYLHLDDGIEERFQCAPGPGGWRYVSQRSDGRRLDLVVDSRWRQIRVELVASDWWIRGGVTGPDLTWVRAASGEGSEHSERAYGFLGDSPAFSIAVARSLALEEPGAEATLRLVRVGGASLSALSGLWRWRLTETSVYETDTAPLPVSEYEMTDLSTGESTAIHVAGDVLLSGPDMELTALESPPNFIA